MPIATIRELVGGFVVFDSSNPICFFDRFSPQFWLGGQRTSRPPGRFDAAAHKRW